MMMLTDAQGAGTAFWPLDKGANFSLERYDGKVCVSHCMAVSKPYNKANRPSYVKLNDGPIKGTFELQAVGYQWSEAMQKVLGAPTKKVQTYAPFYHSYDQ